VNTKQIFSVIVAVVVLLLVLSSCKDRGTDILPLQKFSSTISAVDVLKGATSQISFSGGTLPYSIKRHPDSTKASASLNISILTISGIDTGNTTMVMVDSKTPNADSLEIAIAVLASAPPISFSNQIQPIFERNGQCTGCHGGSGGLTVTAGSSYSNLVNANAQSSCITLKRVLPYDAANSVLYRKVSGTTCGSQMPQGGPFLNAQDIALIRDWINQGANNN
jgi:hypothetical protein